MNNVDKGGKPTIKIFEGDFTVEAFRCMDEVHKEMVRITGIPKTYFGTRGEEVTNLTIQDRLTELTNDTKADD